jgi:2-amino-4-hydroxy-6-hydroxymethyldihydropteridine diphosphokinase
MTIVALALGSNLGARLANLRAGLEALREGGVTKLRASSAWETAPVPADQPSFLNAVAVGETALDPIALLALAKAIEARAGRRPGRHWGPRPLDIDLLFYGEQRVESETLTVPHPLIAERAFVLAPLSEVWPGALPVLGRTAGELLRGVNREGLVRTGERLM